ncbi:MAG: ABC transporter permease [Firmicutes bacterium]|nr:ABC transporter permease [Bacillota bacterium]
MRIAWAVPISLGDSHRGYRVIGTTTDYFEHFKYADRRALQFREGVEFDDLFDVVLGAEVARELGYRLGDSLTLSHGMGSTSFMHHDDLPFRVSGILQPTGTPVGMDSRVASFMVQRQINQYRQEPLSAILPGVALGELWQMLGTVERLLAFTVAVAALFASVGAGQSYLAERFGVLISLPSLNLELLQLGGMVIGVAVLVAVIPAVAAYRQALTQSLAPRV